MFCTPNARNLKSHPKKHCVQHLRAGHLHNDELHQILIFLNTIEFNPPDARGHLSRLPVILLNALRRCITAQVQSTECQVLKVVSQVQISGRSLYTLVLPVGEKRCSARKMMTPAWLGVSVVLIETRHPAPASKQPAVCHSESHFNYFSPMT